MNHRPVFGIGKEEIAKCFDVLSNGRGKVELGALLQKLQLKGNRTATIFLIVIGEKMSSAEVKECFEALLGSQWEHQLRGRTALSAKDFAENILGFEDYDAATSNERPN